MKEITAAEMFFSILKDNKKGKSTGIYSICSAHRTVLEAAMEQAADDGSFVLIESTSNQVDQFGGYTGMKPADFVVYVHDLAEEIEFPKKRILLGGDHLGPNSWQNLPAEEAMAKSRDLIAAYVAAGYAKIHLDCSMFLADDEGDRSKPLSDAVVAERAADLCRTAEETWKRLPEGSTQPFYVIGTEVPIPGGAQEHEETVVPTPAADALQTVEITKKAFHEKDLGEVWNRVCALVVQPGVEFGDDQVFGYNRMNAAALSSALDAYPSLVFEAHSTDYQSTEELTSLVGDHFCILKVGPWLTFAYREALFALHAMENELLGAGAAENSRLAEVLEEVMIENPLHWKKYYQGTEPELLLKRKYSYSDRSRYYWNEQRCIAAVHTLMENLSKTKIPETLLSQFMPMEYQALQKGRIQLHPGELVKEHIKAVLRVYSAACRLSSR